MEPFLKQIARAYTESREGRDILVDCCFVFPNKRSGMFFSNYLSTLAGGTMLQPEVTTISDLILDLTDGVEATRLEQLFTLYQCYSDIITDKYGSDDVTDFDRFQYWGDVILNDFNDVDRYLVDPSMLFKNVKDFREIKSNFLTEEQLEVIREYWDDHQTLESVEAFWAHFPDNARTDDGTAEMSTGFIKLWNVLLNLYRRFRQQLADKGLTYAGMAYREAAERLAVMERQELPYKRYIFAGFNTLSTSEIKIFERLQILGIADFYWDHASPVFADKWHSAMKFLNRYINRFKPLYELKAGEASTPEISIIGVASNVGQAKMAGQILSKLQADGELYSADGADIKTAVVLPDEGLFLPLIHSMPAIDKINITMGYPMRHTPVASLINSVVSMQMRARRVHGEMTFYYEDIVEVLSHPLITSIEPDAAKEIINVIYRDHIYNMPVSRMAGGPLSRLFAVADGTQSAQTTAYTLNMLRWIDSRLADTPSNKIGKALINRYIEAVHEIERLSLTRHIEMHQATFFQLMEKLVANETVNFLGEPLKGLQVMGVLETRALDFDNIVLLSMNENVFPRRHYAKTFIPNALRAGYGMSTVDFQESIYSYYFYRLISRAKRVYLLYDTRSGGLRSGEMSRYLYQLIHLYRDRRLKVKSLGYKLVPAESREISITKTDEVMAKLNRMRDPAYVKTDYFSPSSIDHYICCPLQFYITEVMGFRVDDEMKTFMDEGTYGTIIHDVAQQIYENISAQKNGGDGKSPVNVTDSDLQSALDSETGIDSILRRSINRHYLHKDNSRLDDRLIGEDKILASMMKIFIKRLLEHDRKLTPLTFVAGEYRFHTPVDLGDGMKINIKGSIDRIDRTKAPNGQQVTRIVDYKTGSDKPTISKWEQIFETGNTSHQKSVLQLMLYCNAYMAQPPSGAHPGEHLMPIVYLMREIGAGNNCIEPITIMKQKIYDFADINDEFLEELREKLDELFDPDKPFEPTPDEKACRYCKFTQICGRNPINS